MDMTTHEAAAYLEVIRAWLWWRSKDGRIVAEKRGRDWWIDAAEVERYRSERKPAHRPKKDTSPYEPSDTNTERNTNASDWDEDRGNIPQ